jgi:hypothetical protein
MSEPTPTMPCLCNAYNKRYAAFASNPTALGMDLLNAAVFAFAWVIDTSLDVLRKNDLHDAADALLSFNAPQKRLAHFLFVNNPKVADEPRALAMHVTNIAKYATAEAACDALASSYCVPRKSDLTLPHWYAMVSSTHVCS